MLKIKESNFVRAGHHFDFELEDGTLLHSSEWNGEVYTVNEGGWERALRPVYEHDEECDQYDISWRHYGKDINGSNIITHWMPLPEPPKEETHE